MLTIISGTNRHQSMTAKVAQQALHIAQSMSIETHLLDLATIPNDFVHAEQYSDDATPKWLKDLEAELLIPATHFLIITPEYNGSFPGYLKLFIDALSVLQAKESFANKRAAQIGVSSGRAGNLRGMDHLNDILIHMNCRIIPDHLPISSIHEFIDEDGKMQEETKADIKAKIEHMMTF